MTRRDWAFGFFAVVAAIVCVRLGFWQLDRLQQRRAKNALIIRATASPAVSVGEARVLDTAKLHWRRLSFRGVPDYDHEIVLSSRTQNGSVGVQVVTAVKPIDTAWGDTAVLLIRGWMPAPDGRKYETRSTVEGDTISVDGLATEFPPTPPGAIRMPSAPRAFRALNRDTLSREMKVGLAPFVLLQLGDTVQRDVTKITRVPPPSLSEGSHKSYAVQWFAFATIAVGGFVGYVVTQRKTSGSVRTEIDYGRSGSK
ncbi:MAG: SURF1 family protein [Gemmatimonadota bacterium]|nr:SURF1 family protein [Gemmatimonadota bacterium]